MTSSKKFNGNNTNLSLYTLSKYAPVQSNNHGFIKSGDGSPKKIRNNGLLDIFRAE
jgi:hypothetical protein